MNRFDEQNRIMAERAAAKRCIHCGVYHVWCECSWWRRHRTDVFMTIFCIVTLAVMGYLMPGCYVAHERPFAKPWPAAAGSYNVAPGSPAFVDSGYPIEVQ